MLFSFLLERVDRNSTTTSFSSTINVQNLNFQSHYTHILKCFKLHPQMLKPASPDAQTSIPRCSNQHPQMLKPASPDAQTSILKTLIFPWFSQWFYAQTSIPKCSNQHPQMLKHTDPICSKQHVFVMCLCLCFVQCFRHFKDKDFKNKEDMLLLTFRRHPLHTNSNEITIILLIRII